VCCCLGETGKFFTASAGRFSRGGWQALVGKHERLATGLAVVVKGFTTGDTAVHFFPPSQARASRPQDKRQAGRFKYRGGGGAAGQHLRLAAQVVAYRMESRKTAKDFAAGILHATRVSTAVRSMVEDYEAKH
jgi:hypothetical protein